MDRKEAYSIAAEFGKNWTGTGKDPNSDRIVGAILNLAERLSWMGVDPELARLVAARRSHWANPGDIDEFVAEVVRVADWVAEDGRA